MAFLFANNIVLFGIIILKLNLILNDYISIPFKTFSNDIYMQNEIDKFINDYILNNIYMPIKISQPSQNIIANINSLEHELLMKHVSKSPFDDLNSNFVQKNSSSFNIISNNAELAYQKNSKYVKDNFIFCNNYDINNKKCLNYKNYKDINFIYTEPPDYDEEGNIIENEKKYTYIEIGLNLKSHYSSNGDKYSLANNLFKNNYINSKNWFIYFFPKIKNYNNENNNIENNEGILVLGDNPLNFFGEKYNKDDIRSCQGINKKYDYRDYWSIVFQELKQRTLKADNKNIVIETDLQGVINYNYNVIIGNKHYMDIIEKTFFWPYITQNICHKNLANNKFYFYSCKLFSLNLKEINENFPSLYFKQKEFDFTFELTPQDLFVQIGDRIFFLVVFYKNNPTSSFILGKVFLQKYFFGFENESKKILFYRENDKKSGSGDKNGENIRVEVVLHWYNSTKVIAIMIILLIVFSIVSFYFGKRMYNKRKLRANELEDQFEYKSPFNNKFPLEMK